MSAECARGSRRRLASLAVLGMAFTACVAPPPGLSTARRALLAGDLVTALARLDAVPPADPDYPEARSLAVAVERRLRAGQRFFARGLELRAQWRDDAAIAAFRASRRVWPGLDGVPELIRATDQRRAALESRSAPERSDGQADVATTRPVDLAPPAAPGGGAAAAADPALSLPAANDSVAAVLAAARHSLRRGAVDEALERLEALPVEVRREPRVVDVLADVLHQRALLHYGSGEVVAAIATWRRLLVLQPGHSLAEDFRAAAEVELAARADT